jgi:hypothetical protein
MTGVSDGGKLVRLCKSNSKNTFVFEEQIIATRVGSVGWRDYDHRVHHEGRTASLTLVCFDNYLTVSFEPERVLWVNRLESPGIAWVVSSILPEPRRPL